MNLAYFFTNTEYIISLLRLFILTFLIFPLVGGYDDWNIIKSAKSIGCNVLGIGCCRPPYFNNVNAISDLNKILRSKFFGQHIVIQTVIPALDAHLRDDSPGKALVFSFHGWIGSGKTYLSELIAVALYKEGLNSKFAKFYRGTHDFPDDKLVNSYKETIKWDILDRLKNCEHAMFVFDEVDKTPPGVFDAVFPFIDYGNINGIEHKKAIFIFLSNIGGKDINNISFNAWQAGKTREELTFKDFEDCLYKESFNEKETGLYRSNLIEHALVDYFIPFLPMEKRHIIQCAKSEALRLGGKENSVNVEEIVDGLKYWPEHIKLYSKTGCKRVEGAVKYQLTVKRLEEESKYQLTVKRLEEESENTQDDEEDNSHNKNEL